MTRLGVAAAVIVAGLAVLSGTGQAVDGPSSVQTNGWIESIAFEGWVASYDVHATTRCNRFYLWRLGTGARSQLGGSVTCGADETSTGRGVTRIALTATRAAWIVNSGGNTESADTLLTSWLSRPHETRVARAVRSGDVDGGLAGGWLGGLVSDGTAIAYNAWRTALDETGRQVVTSASLRRLAGTGTRQLAAGTGTLLAQAADRGRIAVLRADGTVALYLATGRLQLVVTPSAPGLAVALSGSRLAVLTSAGRLEVYDVRGGPPRKTWPAARIATRIDLEGRWLAYGAGRRVFALDVVSGRTRTLATARRSIVDVEIEPSGVLYAYNGFSHGQPAGHVVFLPATSQP